MQLMEKIPIIIQDFKEITMSDDGRATIDQWTRKKERMEDDDREAKKNMKAAIKYAMKDEDTHRNIARELLRARQGGETIKDQSGFGDDEEIITGYHEDRPWERD